MQLLPENFDELVARAIQVFWASRSRGSSTQGGIRGEVISGKNLDGFLAVARAVARHCGVPDSSVYFEGKTGLVLPGYFRPSKTWDVVVVHRARLLAVLEFKSAVGSFGNNFNNRSEEVIGSASDLWVAARKGAYSASNCKASAEVGPPDPRQPFLGYLMLLQDCAESTRSVAGGSSHYHLLPEFTGASYADRYRILCERLMEQNLYGAAALVVSAETPPTAPGRWRSLSAATDVRSLFTELAARLWAGVQR